MQLKPTLLTWDQAKKVLKVVLWVAASGAMTALVTQLTNRPDLFGPLYPAVNVLLVMVKQLFTKT